MKTALKFLCALACIFFGASFMAGAVVKELELAPGKKVLHVSKMSIPGDITLAELLQIFPEFTARDDDDAISRFDLQIDDVSCGSSKLTMMKHLRVCDIKDVELSQFPSASQQNNGQGGVINIILKDHAGGLSGNALLEASTKWDVSPAVTLNYGTDKLSVTGSLIGRYDHPKNNSIETLLESKTTGATRTFEDNKKHYGTEFANVRVKYTPDNHQTLKAWLLQSYEKDFQKQALRRDSMDAKAVTNSMINQDRVSLTTGLNYKYEFQRGSIEAQAVYEYIPKKYVWKTDAAGIYSEDYIDGGSSHSLDMFIKGSYQIIPTTSDRKCKLESGLNFKATDSRFGYRDIYFDSKGDEAARYNLNAGMYPVYLSPYIQLDSRFNQMYLKCAFRYQYYAYRIWTDSADPFRKGHNDFTATINAGFNLENGHNLSVTLDKSIQRPDDRAIYPFRYYDTDRESYVKGNSMLIPEDIYTASLDYQYDWANLVHSFSVGGGLKYYHTANIITNGVEYLTPTYVNNGSSNIFGVNLIGQYSVGPFSLTFNGNVFRNWNKIGGKPGKYFSYNIAAIPRLSFKDDWRITGRFEYNSQEERISEMLGPYFYSEVRLTKGWKNWNFYMKLTDNFHRLVEDVDFSTPDVKITRYYLHFPGFGLGAIVNF